LAGLQKEPYEGEKIKRIKSLVPVQMHFSAVLSVTLRFIIFNRRDAEKNQEKKFFGS
jgi:hypothetical protein